MKGKIRLLVLVGFLACLWAAPFLNAQSVLSTPQGGTGSKITPPTVPSDYLCEFHVVNIPVGITCPQSGMGSRGIFGATSSGTIVFSDNTTIVEHDYYATSSVSVSLPTPITLQNSKFFFSYANHTLVYTDSIVPAGGYTINSHSSLPISPGQSYRIYVDPTSSSTNWLADPLGVAAGGSASSYTILTDGATIIWAVSGPLSNAEVTLGGSRTLAISGASSGWQGSLVVNQGTGSHTLTAPYGSYVEGGGAGLLSLSSGVNAIDRLQVSFDGVYYYWDATHKNYTAVAGGGSPVIGQACVGYGFSENSQTCVMSSNVASTNDVLVVGVMASASGTLTVSGCGATWTTDAPTGSGSTATGLSPTAGACTITASYSGAAGSISIGGVDVTGTTGIDQRGTRALTGYVTSGSTINGVPVTTTDANDLVIAIFIEQGFGNGIQTAGSGFSYTSGVNSHSIGIEAGTKASPGAVSPTATSADSSVFVINTVALHP